VDCDAQLISETLRGNTERFGQLVRKHQDRLYNTLVRFVGCRELALDLAQEAFIQALVKLHTFEQNSAFYTWLYRIAFNLAITHLRRRRPEISVEAVREAGGPEPVGDGDAPDRQLERNEDARQVHQAIGRLSEEHRAILLLREMEGLCYTEIAEILDLPVGTVRSRLHRARNQLRDRLEEMFQEQHA